MIVETAVEIESSKSNNNNNNKNNSFRCGLDVTLLDTRQVQEVFLVSKAFRGSAKPIILILSRIRGFLCRRERAKEQGVQQLTQCTVEYIL